MLLLLIMSCHKDCQAGMANDAIRDTFLKEWPLLTHKFIVGADTPTPPAGDAVWVSAPDDYGSLLLKQRAAYEWALTTNATHVFVSFTDTYIHIPRLMTCGYEPHDYMGLKVKHGPDFISGGNGYFLSRRALIHLTHCTPIAGMQGDEWDGCMLKGFGYKANYDDRFGTTITRHLSQGTGNYDPKWMHDAHKEMISEKS